MALFAPGYGGVMLILAMAADLGPEHRNSLTFLHKARMLVPRLSAALSLVAAVTFVSGRLIHVNATTAGFFYLLAILAIATAWGLLESTVASVAAVLCFNFFFLPPIGTFTVADPQNWIALFTFLATSLTASQLSARAKHQTREAVEHQLELERLYALSRALLLTDASQSMARQIAQQVGRTFDFPAVAVYEHRAARFIGWVRRLFRGSSPGFGRRSYSPLYFEMKRV